MFARRKQPVILDNGGFSTKDNIHEDLDIHLMVHKLIKDVSNQGGWNTVDHDNSSESESPKMSVDINSKLDGILMKTNSLLEDKLGCTSDCLDSFPGPKVVESATNTEWEYFLVFLGSYKHATQLDGQQIEHQLWRCL